MNEAKSKESVVRVVKFVLFSVSAGGIQALSFAFFKEVTGFKYWPAYIIALTLSVVWNFTLNRNFTFKSAANVPKAMLLVIAFYAVFTPVSTILGDHFDRQGVNNYLILAVTMLSNLTLEYLYDRYVVFRKTINTRQSKRS